MNLENVSLKKYTLIGHLLYVINRLNRLILSFQLSSGTRVIKYTALVSQVFYNMCIKTKTHKLATK